MESARLFNCARCREQIMICSPCDRGNNYCKRCSPIARIEARRRSSKTYQNTTAGKINHAARQKAYRERQRNKVTHQGSQILSPNVLLHPEPNEHAQEIKQATADHNHCHFCDRPCSSYLRNGYLRTRADVQVQRTRARLAEP